MYPNLLKKRVSLTPTRLALSTESRSYTWQQVMSRVHELAGKLPFESGSRVGIWAKNSEDVYFWSLALMWRDCEIVFFNERLSEKEWAYQEKDASVSLVLVDDKRRFTNCPPNIVTFEEVADHEVAPYSSTDMWEPDRTISIMYTSGTTGKPKGVRQTLENHMTSALGAALTSGVLPEDKWLCMVPLFHISGFSMIMRSLVYGSALELHERFDAEVAVEAICNRGVTHFSVVTTMLGNLLDVIERDDRAIPSSFRVLLAGGGPVPKTYLLRAQAHQLPVLQTYGMTETSSQTCTLMPEDALEKLGSVGKPLFFADIRIDGEAEGEIWIKGAHVTPGYIGDFREKNPLTEDGWFRTGDIGRLDADGYLYVLDRRSDLIVSGGENVYPAEIEQVLMNHPHVKEAGVVGMEDTKWGQVPVAYVVMEPQDEESLRQLSKETLAKFKQPVIYHFVASLPRNASNKLVRRELKP
ncbi:o-succinylbenzoate--CoA ligase [Chryseomicrobium palamuruense]|uniref:2-succinylbenzoate--CoA ligase n=1 Tax=Chryseomicrobium palamuruense TaxID=682973 RepID=A0ABV8UWY5_9BACL